MSLALPTPERPGAARDHVRAHRRWQAGRALAQQAQWPRAAREFEQASGLHRDPAYALAAIHALIKAGRSAEAAERARALREVDPRSALAWTLESHALLGLGRAAEAIDGLQSMPADLPRDHGHHVSLGVALQRCRRHQEAIRSFLDALALKMDDALSHFRLGMSFKDLGMKAEAAECVRTAVLLGLDSSELAARGQLAFLEREACRWSQADEAMLGLREALRAVPDDIPLETSPFAHAVLVDEPLEQLKVSRHYALHMASMYPALPRRIARPRPGRLRVGYLSADFHQHATAQLMAQMLECHDRAAFEVTLLSGGPRDDSPMRRRLRAGSERFEELHGQSFEAMARRIRELDIDLLVDLKGATYDTLLPVLAQRPAPLQVTWLGFPGTTGAPYIDYLIGDRIVTPLDDAAHFSEKIAQLPHCYQPNDAQRARPEPSLRADWGVPEGALLLCAFHQSYKISAAVMDEWCRLLHALPGAVLWLLQWNTNVQAALTEAARQRGIGVERIAFAPLLPLEQHLSRLACADIYLDAWPCNAHTTAGEALWVGVPVVTLGGRTFAQRVASSLLHAAGLDELVCADRATYSATVLALAGDAPRRQALRARLERQRGTCRLFDGAAFARDIEALYRRMWARAVAGQGPEFLAAQESSTSDPATSHTTSSRA